MFFVRVQPLGYNLRTDGAPSNMTSGGSVGVSDILAGDLTPKSLAFDDVSAAFQKYASSRLSKRPVAL